MSILLWFPSVLHKVTLPESPELPAMVVTPSEICQHLKLTEGMPLALPLEDVLVSFQVMSVNLDRCSDKNICQVNIRLKKHWAGLRFTSSKQKSKLECK